MLTNTVEPRRIVKHASKQLKEPHSCQGCGEHGFLQSIALPFCASCLDWARQKNLVEWDDLGGGD